MVSERLLHTRSKYLVLLALIVLHTSAGYLLAQSKYLPAVVLFLSGLLAAWMILWLYDGTNQAIAYFFNALRNDDTTLQFPAGLKNKSLARLYENINHVNRHIQDIKIQSEYNEKYYRTLIKHSVNGLLVLNSDNQVELINRVACKYAGISSESTNAGLLKIKNPAFYEAICKLQPGEDITYKHVLGNDFLLLSFRATLLRKNNLAVKLVSILDIRHELESKELESYRKLISVLTHEIMNLMSPLTSVSKALYSMYNTNNQSINLKDMNEDILNTTLQALQVIDEQSNGLLNFMDNYRKISRIPQPDIKPFDVDDWIEQLTIVYSDKMREHSIAFTIDYNRILKTILADKKLLNQVIINLVNNAMDAVMEIEGERKISIEILTIHQNRVLIKVTNNGPLIPTELQEKIFVPFFTTKKNGSGIGLSICQEIMKLHKGSLTVVSATEGKTSFLMEI